MRILGLDLSLTSTGYCMLEDDQIVWSGAVGGGHRRGAERLQYFYGWISDNLALNFGAMHRQPSPAVAIEGYAFASHFKGPELGELGGVIKLALYQAGLSVTVIPPATWKKVLCGKGNLDKRNASTEILRRYDVSFANEDTLDAWAVAMCHRRQLLGLDKPEPKPRTRRRTTSSQGSLSLEAPTHA